jgi:hypothetical protein
MTQYSMIRRFEVSNFEFNELGAVVLPRAESDWKNHRAKWVRRITWDNAIERRFALNQHIREVQTHFPQSASEDEVETAPTVDEHIGEPDFYHHRVQNQGELTRLRKACPLIITGEQDGHLRPAEWSWCRRLDGHGLPEKQFLFPPGTEVSIPPEDDVDGLRSILKLWVAPLVPLVIVFGFFVHWLLVLLVTTGIAESPLKVVTINCRLIGTRMPWAFLLQELLELLLHCRLLTSRGTIHNRDEIIWLALSGWTQIVPLALVVAVVIWTLQVAILAPREPLPHLLFLLGPVVHHVTKARNSFSLFCLKSL